MTEPDQAVVDALLRFDAETVVNAYLAGDETRLRMADGSPVNDIDRLLLRRAGIAEIEAVKQILQRRAETLETSHRRLDELVDKYAISNGELLGAVVSRMTDEDYDDLQACLAVVFGEEVP